MVCPDKILVAALESERSRAAELLAQRHAAPLIPQRCEEITGGAALGKYGKGRLSRDERKIPSDRPDEV